MKLKQIINKIETVKVEGNIPDAEISGIFYDSRKVVSGGIFVAIKGFNTDGHKYLTEAVRNGAYAVILEDESASFNSEVKAHNVLRILVMDTRKALAELSHYFYNEPSSRLKIIGITGTNGKTTTSYYLKKIFETAGEKTGLTGTIQNMIGSEQIYTELTTPESNDLNRLFDQMYDSGCKYAVMEVSSHALLLKRVHAINFSAAVFTNITSDHMDFHSTFDNYFEAKKILFDSLTEKSYAVYNKDDNNGERIVSGSKAAIFSYGTTENADLLMKNIFYDINGTQFTIQYKGRDYKIVTGLAGEFNAYNAAAAFAAAVLLEIAPETAAEGIKSTKQVPGRFEVVGEGKKKVIIDYSHTADSLEKALSALSNISKGRPVYTVFGCGGNRDKAKRPIMGRIASELSHQAIITSDNPRNENPFEIINDIKKGISKNNYLVIESREEAIKHAVESSEEDAVILIAGKGHEDYQEIKGIRHHFSDKETALKYLSR